MPTLPPTPQAPDSAGELAARRRMRATERERRRRIQRRRAIAAGVAAIAIAAVVVVAALGHSARRRAAPSAASSAASTAGASSTPPPASSATANAAAATPTRAPFAVGVRVLRLADRSRALRLPGGGTEPRPLVTIVRYPAVGRPGGGDHPGAAAARAAGPFPLVVFGHGFAVTPSLYGALLRAWAAAGYVVAAPVFPLENANAPGGPNESDLVNQPQDMHFVISQLLGLSASKHGALGGLLDPARIAVSGQSDGGDTALAVAYDGGYRDPRVRAAVILSGAKIPGVGFAFPKHGAPPLLATQGDADSVNPPSSSHGFYDYAPRPKYYLELPGAAHLPPYSVEQPQLGVVERVTIAFLTKYLGGHGAATAPALGTVGNVAGVARLFAQP